MYEKGELQNRKEISLLFVPFFIFVLISFINSLMPLKICVCLLELLSCVYVKAAQELTIYRIIVERSSLKKYPLCFSSISRNDIMILSFSSPFMMVFKYTMKF